MRNKSLAWALAAASVGIFGLSVYNNKEEQASTPETLSTTPDLTVKGYLSAFYFSLSNLNAKDLIKAEAIEGCVDNYEYNKETKPQTCAYVFNTVTHISQNAAIVPELSGTANLSCSTTLFGRKRCDVISLKLNN